MAEQKITLIPLEDHVLVEPIEAEKTTKSGIILPNNKDEKPGCGIVVAVGPGKILDDGKRWPMDVCVGDKVFFTKYAPDEIETEIQGEKKKILCIKQSSVLAKECSGTCKDKKWWCCRE